ncbi:MAG: ABC transporter ATP-binding protein [Desulfosarcina sp.]|nr:ABC transporter ATP-binding protein [Desulfosarcina sp.]MBC2742651.1 ABC transporter ATP-binding protein [Desulfosarcina sp.]MBC2765561.1 ABC transporter ATP-binding protein [Desulfosarcina sp.]
MPQPIYRIENLVHRYNSQPVLVVDRLEIEPASILGLVGPNGSGKSTLLKLMAFILRPTEGQILFDGMPAAPFDESVRFQVTLLTQEPYLMKRTVFKNIAYGLKVRGDRENWTKPVRDALAMVGLDPNTFSRRQWDELSGGEAQRVAMAARLVLRPRVLLLDEPTTSVDAASSELIRAASLRARSEWGTTLVIASHDREWLYDVCDEVIHLFKGKPAGTGRSNMIFGPWIPEDNGLCYKLLGDGRRLTVSAPPNADATAFIDPADIRILGKGEETATANTVSVDGTVTRLSLERQSGDLFADVRAGSLTLIVRVAESHLAAMTLHRGWPVTLAYRPDSIRWQ